MSTRLTLALIGVWLLRPAFVWAEDYVYPAIVESGFACEFDKHKLAVLKSSFILDPELHRPVSYTHLTLPTNREV